MLPYTLILRIKNLKNFARSYFCYMIIMAVLFIILIFSGMGTVLAGSVKRCGQDCSSIEENDPGGECLLFFIISTANFEFSYSLPQSSGGIAMDGNSAVTRHGCRIDGDPSPANIFSQTVRKLKFTVRL